MVVKLRHLVTTGAKYSSITKLLLEVNRVKKAVCVARKRTVDFSSATGTNTKDMRKRNT